MSSETVSHGNNTTPNPLHEVIEQNKVQNEEYKIWKKIVPSLYQHICTFKPHINIKDIESAWKSIIFMDIVKEDPLITGLLGTTILYSINDQIFQFELKLPFGSKPTQRLTHALSLPKYDEEEIDEFLQDMNYQSKWIWPNVMIKQMLKISNDDILALSQDGLIAWFKNGIRKPIKIFDYEERSDGSDFLFDISEDKCTAVEIGNVKETNNCTIKLIKLSGSSNEIIPTISVLDCQKINCIRFLDNVTFFTSSTDNIIRVWSISSDGNVNNKPIYMFKIPENDGKVLSIGKSPMFETLLLVGTDKGIIKFYDLRTIQKQESLEKNCILELYQLQDDPVMSIEFSQIVPSQFISVGMTGNILHWDLSYFISKLSEEDLDEIDSLQKIVSQEELLEACLSFYHTGGNRRKNGTQPKQYTVSLNTQINDLVVCVDQDGLITEYIPCIGRYFDDEEEEEENDEVEQENTDEEKTHTEKDQIETELTNKEIETQS